jgi:hypothetical protein
MLIRSVAQYDCNGRLTRKPAPRAVLVVFQDMAMAIT